VFYFSRRALELKHTETKEPLKQPWNVFAGSDMQFCAWTPPTAETFRCFIFYVLCDGWNQKQFVDSKRNLLYCFVSVLLQLRGTIISFSNVCGSGLGSLQFYEYFCRGERLRLSCGKLRKGYVSIAVNTVPSRSLRYMLFSAVVTARTAYYVKWIHKRSRCSQTWFGHEWYKSGIVTITIESSTTSGATTLSRMTRRTFWIFTTACCSVVWYKVRIRVWIRFSVWLVSCYAHVFVLLSVVIVTLLIRAVYPSAA